MQRTQPSRSAVSEPWFVAASEGKLLLQRCGECGHWQFYPRILCTACGSAEPEWVEASGAGTIVSYTVVRRGVSRAYETPYVVALISLAEGPCMMSNIVDADPEVLRIGMPVTVRFEAWSDEVSLPVFVLAGTLE